MVVSRLRIQEIESFKISRIWHGFASVCQCVTVKSKLNWFSSRKPGFTKLKKQYPTWFRTSSKQNILTTYKIKHWKRWKNATSRRLRESQTMTLLLRFEASTFHPVWFVVEENEMVLTTFNLDDNMNFGKNPKAWANPTLIEKKRSEGCITYTK